MSPKLRIVSTFIRERIPPTLPDISQFSSNGKAPPKASLSDKAPILKKIKYTRKDMEPKRELGLDASEDNHPEKMGLEKEVDLPEPQTSEELSEVGFVFLLVYFL